MFDNVLICPVCHGTNLHQEKVIVFWRNQEDQNGHRVVSTKSDAWLSPTQSRFIPGRRHHIRIFFSCENCDNELSFGITQHKGQTILAWEEIKQDDLVALMNPDTGEISRETDGGYPGGDFTEEIPSFRFSMKDDGLTEAIGMAFLSDVRRILEERHGKK